MGCGYAQGFFFSEALDPAEAEAFMACGAVLSTHAAGTASARRWPALIEHAC